MSDADIKLPSEPAAPDPARLRSIVETIRAQYHDPNSIFANRPDLVESSELRMKSLLLRAGIDDKPETPAAMAARQNREAWSHEDHPAFTAMMAERRQELQQLGTEKLEARAADLRRTMGPAYFRMLEQAKQGLGFAEVVPLEVQADEHLLRQAVAQAQWRAAKARATRS